MTQHGTTNKLLYENDRILITQNDTGNIVIESKTVEFIKFLIKAKPFKIVKLLIFLIGIFIFMFVFGFFAFLCFSAFFFNDEKWPIFIIGIGSSVVAMAYLAMILNMLWYYLPKKIILDNISNKCILRIYVIFNFNVCYSDIKSIGISVTRDRGDPVRGYISTIFLSKHSSIFTIRICSPIMYSSSGIAIKKAKIVGRIISKAVDAPLLIKKNDKWIKVDKRN